MKIWKRKVNITVSKRHNVPKWETFEVRELTDKEAIKLRKTGNPAMPISTGFVCLFQDGEFVTTCGSAYAAEHKIEPLSRAKGYRKLSKEDKTELQKFNQFLKLLTKRKDLIGQSEIKSAQITDECYTTVYGGSGLEFL